MKKFTTPRIAVTTIAFAVSTLAIVGCPAPGDITPRSGDKTITDFTFVGYGMPGTIDEDSKTITLMMPTGTDVTALVAEFSTTGSSVRVGTSVQVSGSTANDFSDPVIYTVAAEDGTTVSYTVTVMVALSNAKAMTAFSFADPPATGVIEEYTKTITVAVPLGTDATALVAIFSVTGTRVKVGAADQESGVTANDFSSPVLYTVVAEDGSSVDYSVVVLVGSWQVVGIAGFSEGTARFTSLAIDPTGTPYLAYNDEAYGAKTVVMKFDGTSWLSVGTPGFSAGGAAYVSLAIDPTGTPYVAYQDTANDKKATVMVYNAGSWQTVGTAGFSAAQAHEISLAIGPDGIPHVAYMDSGNSNKATVMRYSGTAWEALGTEGFSAGLAGYPSIAIDSTGIVYVGYQDGANGGLATVMKYADGSWQTVGTAGFSAASPVDVSVALDPSDDPCIAYCRGGANVMRYSEGSWQLVGAAGFSGGGTEDTSLAIDSSGTPYVAYRDSATFRATVMKYTGGSWEAVGLAGFSTDSVGDVSLAMDPNDTPYVAYGAKGYGSTKATVWVYR